MAKGKAKAHKKPQTHPVDKRPGQLIALLVILGIVVLACVSSWLFYTVNNIVGGNSLPVPAELLPIYRVLLLLTAAVSLAIWLLSFFGRKAGFWAATVFFALDLIVKLLALNLPGALLSSLCLYCLLCEVTRVYFRIGRFKALGPRQT